MFCLHKAAQAAVRQSSELSRVVSNQAPSATAAGLPATTTPRSFGYLEPTATVLNF